MRPSFSFENETDHRARKSYGLCDVDACLPKSIHLEDADDGGFVDACLSVQDASAIRLSSFVEHVLHVVLLRSEEQMIGTDAEMDVAVVKDFHPFWNGSEVNDPRDAMCDMTDVEKGNTSVTTLWTVDSSAFGSSPQPVVVGLFDAPPEVSQLSCCERRDHHQGM